jgi:hypothetical protein
MVKWLKDNGTNVKRPINSLTKHELECLAEAATSTYIKEAAHKVVHEPDTLEGIMLAWIL